MQIVRLNCAFSRNLGRGDDVDGLGAIMRGILSFLEKYLLVFLINGLTFLTVRPGGKDSVNHVAAGFLWLHLLSVVGGRFPGRFYKVFQILHGGKSLSLEIGQGFADCL